MYKVEIFGNEIHVTLCRKNGTPTVTTKWEIKTIKDQKSLSLIGEEPNLLPHIAKQMYKTACDTIFYSS